MPPIVIAGAALAAGGIVGSIVSSNNAADAQRDVSNAQLSQADREALMAQQTRERAFSLAGATPDELIQLQNMTKNQDRLLTLQGTALDRQKQLLDSIDPALAEAGNQAYQLLKGQSAAALGPIQTQRSQQRAELVGKLREQLGAGYETSTPGIQALNKFDQDTTSLMQNAQDQTLGRLLGVAQQSRPDYLGDVNRAATTLGNVSAQTLSAYGGIQSRQISALTGTQIPSLTQYVGGDAKAGVTQNQGYANAFGQVTQLGGMGLGAGITSGGFNSTPTGTNPSTLNYYTPPSSTFQQPTFGSSLGRGY